MGLNPNKPTQNTETANISSCSSLNPSSIVRPIKHTHRSCWFPPFEPLDRATAAQSIDRPSINVVLLIWSCSLIMTHSPRTMPWSSHSIPCTILMFFVIPSLRHLKDPPHKNDLTLTPREDKIGCTKIDSSNKVTLLDNVSFPQYATFSRNHAFPSFSPPCSSATKQNC